MSDWLDQVHSSWMPILQSCDEQLAAVSHFLENESLKQQRFFPESNAIFNAFALPFEDVKVLIVGQDPYPTVGHAMGLAFGVNREVWPLPKSLTNIFKELQTDTGCAAPQSGDVRPWVQQGVMLLNRVLTVREGEPGSHRGIGWESITYSVIEALASRPLPVVVVLWGKDAQTVSQLFSEDVVVSSAHPSPLSAHRGFFGSRPFTHVNNILSDLGESPINWCLP